MEMLLGETEGDAVMLLETQRAGQVTCLLRQETV
jgi:hypothetical protein